VSRRKDISPKNNFKHVNVLYAPDKFCD